MKSGGQHPNVEETAPPCCTLHVCVDALVLPRPQVQRHATPAQLHGAQCCELLSVPEAAGGAPRQTREDARATLKPLRMHARVCARSFATCEKLPNTFAEPLRARHCIGGPLAALLREFEGTFPRGLLSSERAKGSRRPRRMSIHMGHMRRLHGNRACAPTNFQPDLRLSNNRQLSHHPLEALARGRKKHVSSAQAR